MLTFLKLGGSLITDKSQSETAHLDVLDRIANEIRGALDESPDLRLVIGHGSGSFGHVAAKHYQTHLGVSTPNQWVGFAKVALAASRLTNLVLDALDHAGVPAFRVQPSASAVCDDGKLIDMASTPIKHVLEHGLVPLVFGDVAIDTQRGGGIISTEDVFSFLAQHLQPSRMLLAGDYEGVYDASKQIVPHITRQSLEALSDTLGGSAHTDVTGGMAGKVSSMIDLCDSVPGLSVQIFSGDEPGMIQRILSDSLYAPGTLISSN
jgi:isopentenyl phosphate kinase